NLISCTSTRSLIRKCAVRPYFRLPTTAMVAPPREPGAAGYGANPPTGRRACVVSNTKHDVDRMRCHGQSGDGEGSRHSVGGFAGRMISVPGIGCSAGAVNAAWRNHESTSRNVDWETSWVRYMATTGAEASSLLRRIDSLGA